LKGSLLQISITIALVALLSFAFGWVTNLVQGIFLGAILSLSSTAVVLKTLTERGEVNTVHGQIMLAILIAQDLALGLMLAILPALNQPGNLVLALTIALGKAIIFVAAALAMGYWVIPWLMKRVVETENSELFLLTVIALCLGVALLTAKLGLSIEMGAFVAGLTISEIDYSDQALAKVIPLRDTFASLFFASIGMLVEPNIIFANIGVILGLVTLVMLGKAIVIFPIIWQFGYSFKTAVISSLGLNQIGEFSFVLALVAFDLGFIPQASYLLLIGTTAITLMITPIIMEFAPEIAQKLTNVAFISKFLEKRDQKRSISLPQTIQDHVVVAGYGRVGQVIVTMMQNQGYQVLAIENSEAAIQKLRQRKIPYIFGDADAELVLEKAHLNKAKALAIALPDPTSTRILLKLALKIAPHLSIVVRAHTDKEIDILTNMGAMEVVQPEFEAALEMGGQILMRLGESAQKVNSIVQTIRHNRYLSLRKN
ncbi:MAG: sodium:calcium exchanger, partial [Cyanobacteria bacterium J083]